MVLTIRYDSTGETETFLLGRRGAEDADITVCSMASPLGRAIAGARPGEQRIYPIPDERGLLVTLPEAVPYEMHIAKGPRPQYANCGERQSPGNKNQKNRQRPGNEAWADEIACRASPCSSASAIGDHHSRVTGRNRHDDEHARRVDLAASLPTATKGARHAS
jgi:hypothetical protein